MNYHAQWRLKTTLTSSDDDDDRAADARANAPDLADFMNMKVRYDNEIKKLKKKLNWS